MPYEEMIIPDDTYHFMLHALGEGEQRDGGFPRQKASRKGDAVALSSAHVAGLRSAARGVYGLNNERRGFAVGWQRARGSLASGTGVPS